MHNKRMELRVTACVRDKVVISNPYPKYSGYLFPVIIEGTGGDIHAVQSYNTITGIPISKQTNVLLFVKQERDDECYNREREGNG